VSNKAALDEDVERLIRKHFPNRKGPKHPIESNERRAILDSFVTAQFETVGDSGELIPKCAPSEFWIEAQKLTGWTKRTVSSTARLRSEAEIEFQYLTNAFLGIWVELPIHRKLTAEQGAERRELVRKNSLPIHEFLKDHGGDSARCVLANWLIQKWCGENNPELLCEAKALYENAADAGSLEALYSLGAAELFPAGAKYMVPKPEPTFLIDDELLRRDYIERAADAGYHEAIAHLESEENARRDLLEEELWHSQFRDDAQAEHDEDLSSERRTQECDLPQLRDIANSGDLDAACCLAEWLLRSAKDIRSRRHPNFIDRSDGFLELSADAEPTASAYEREAREVIKLGVVKEHPSSLRVLAEEGSFGIDKQRRFDLLMKAAFPTNADYEADFFAIQSLAWLEYEPDQYEDAERVMRLWISIRPPAAYDGTELELAKIYEETGAFEQAEVLLRDHLKHRKAKDHTEIRLARLIRSHLSELGSRASEVLALLESIANVNGEAAMLAGLMRLRGDGCEANRELAKVRFEECKAIQKRPGHTKQTIQEAVYIDIVLPLGWGEENSLYEATEAILKIAYSGEFKGTYVAGPIGCEILGKGNKSLKAEGARAAVKFDVLQFCIDDARILMNGNNTLQAISELDVLRPEFGRVVSVELLLESLLLVVLSNRPYDKSGQPAFWMKHLAGSTSLVPENSMVWSFLVGQLIISDRAKGASRSDPIDALERVISLEEKISEAEREEKHKHLAYKGLRRWIHKTTLEDLSYVRQHLAETEAAENLLAEFQRKAEAAAAKAKTDIEKMTAIAEERARTLSALTHTLHNALGTGPLVVSTAVRIIGSKAGSKPSLESVADDLTSLHATFNFVNEQIQTFRLYTADPDKLRAEAMAEQPNLPSIGEVVAGALKQVLARVLFDPDIAPAFRLLRAPDNDERLIEIRRTSRHDIFSNDSTPDAATLAEWVANNLPGLNIRLAPEAFHRALHNRTQHALIFAVISELLFNAVHHGGDSEPIEIVLSANRTTTTLTIKNALIDSNGKETMAIGNGGLSFIEKLLDYLVVPGFFHASFSPDSGSAPFITSLTFTDEREYRNENRMD
jgi:hypothetical protein